MYITKQQQEQILSHRISNKLHSTENQITFLTVWKIIYNSHKAAEQQKNFLNIYDYSHHKIQTTEIS